MTKRCPPVCRPDCNVNHHPLLIALLNTVTREDSVSFTALEATISRYEKIGVWTKDADIPDPVKELNSPLLLWAVFLGYTEVVKWLRERQFSQTVTISSTGEGALHLAVKSVFTKNIKKQEVFQELVLLLPCALTIRDKHGNSALHYCCTEYLSDVKTKDVFKDCATVMLTFAMNNNSAIVSTLVNTQNNEGNTLLHILAGDDKCLKFLKFVCGLQKSDYTIRNLKNDTPLDIALRNGAMETSAYLMLKSNSSSNNTSKVPSSTVDKLGSRQTRNKPVSSPSPLKGESNTVTVVEQGQIQRINLKYIPTKPKQNSVTRHDKPITQDTQKAATKSPAEKTGASNGKLPSYYCYNYKTRRVEVDTPSESPQSQNKRSVLPAKPSNTITQIQTKLNSIDTGTQSPPVTGRKVLKPAIPPSVPLNQQYFKFQTDSNDTGKKSSPKIVPALSANGTESPLLLESIHKTQKGVAAQQQYNTTKQSASSQNTNSTPVSSVKTSSAFSAVISPSSSVVVSQNESIVSYSSNGPGNTISSTVMSSPVSDVSSGTCIFSTPNVQRTYTYIVPVTRKTASTNKEKSVGLPTVVNDERVLQCIQLSNKKNQPPHIKMLIPTSSEEGQSVGDAEMNTVSPSNMCRSQESNGSASCSSSSPQNVQCSDSSSSPEAVIVSSSCTCAKQCSIHMPKPAQKRKSREVDVAEPVDKIIKIEIDDNDDRNSNSHASQESEERVSTTNGKDFERKHEPSMSEKTFCLIRKSMQRDMEFVRKKKEELLIQKNSIQGVADKLMESTKEKTTLITNLLNQLEETQRDLLKIEKEHEETKKSEKALVEKLTEVLDEEKDLDKAFEEIGLLIEKKNSPHKVTSPS